MVEQYRAGLRGRLADGAHAGPASGVPSVKPSSKAQSDIGMGVRRGGQEGSLAPPPPWPDKIVYFSTFLVENSMFLGIF